MFAKLECRPPIGRVSAWMELEALLQPYRAAAWRNRLLTVTRLKQLFRYDPETGRWYSLVDGAGAIYPRKTRYGRKSYISVTVDGGVYQSARLAYFYMTGEWPPQIMDHKDRDIHNDRWENLRPATFQQNSANAAVHKRKKHPLPKGVNWNSSQTAYIARISVYGRNENLGEFERMADAEAAYNRRSSELHGEYAVNNWAAPPSPPNPEADKPVEAPARDDSDWLPEGRIVAPPIQIAVERKRRVRPSQIEFLKDGRILGDKQERQPRFFRSF